MTYLRPVRLTELVDFLYAEGVGGSDDDLIVEDLARKMVNKFDILTYSMEQA